MKSVVIIAYNFPPDGSAGVYRPLRFVRHLTGVGWHPTVVAADNKRKGRYDPGLLSLVPDDVEIVRISGEDIWQRFQAWRGQGTLDKNSEGRPKKVSENSKVQTSPIRSSFRNMVRACEGLYYHPDSAMPWIKPAVTTTMQVCQQTNAKVIWVTGGPWSSFVVAEKVSLLTGLPYVLDFRDSWTLAGSPFYNDRPEWAKRRDRRLLFQLFKGAQAIMFRYQSEAECYWRAYPKALEPSRIHIIPNGFDGQIEEPIPIAENQSKCIILYAGEITPYRYDTLLQGLSILKKTFPNLISHLQFRFVGEGMDALVREASILGVSDLVRARPSVPYAEVCRLQKEADALLLLGLPSQMGYELCGSKVFAYLKACRPIVGILPFDENRNVLNRVGITTIADINSPSEISTVLKQVLEAWQKGRLPLLLPDRNACEAYSAERQTVAMVRALEGGPSEDPFVPGSVEIPLSLQDVIGRQGWI